MQGRLAVLTGRHDGALSPTTAAGTLIGSAAECDIVLTDGGVQPVHATFTPAGASAVLRALGEARIDAPGLSTTTDGAVSVRLWQPVQLGPVWLCWVPENFAWGDTVPWPRPRPVAEPPRRHWVAALGVGIAVSGLLLLVALIALLANAREERVSLTADPLAAAESRLRGLEMPDITLTRDAGRLNVEGWVASRAEFDRLLDAVGPLHGTVAAIRVRIGEEVARRAGEFAGAQVQADYVGGGRIRLRAPAATAAEAAQIAARVQRLRADLGDAVVIEAELPATAAAPAVAQPIPVQIVEVQTDDPPHFRTADGARYFIGARLPDGAEVVHIAQDEIVFRRGERLIPYRLLD